MRLWMPHTTITARPGGASQLSMRLFAILTTRMARDLLGKKLAQRGRGWVHVNPIPLNPTPGSKWTASRKGVEQNFVERLRAHGIPTTIRDTRGSDIDGACGQLAAKEEE